jgi:hypothetical protein
VGDIRKSFIFVLEDLKVGDHLEDLGIDCTKILKRIFESTMQRCGLDSSYSGCDGDWMQAGSNTPPSIVTPKNADRKR